MSEQDRREEPPAPGHWRVTAQPMAAAAARPQAAPGSMPVAPAVPARTSGRPLIATLVCVGVLGLSLAGQSSTPMEASGDAAGEIGFVLGGALFGAILWGIAYAITIRKASTRWKAGSLIVLAVLGGLVTLAHMAGTGSVAPNGPPPVVRAGK